VQDAIVHGRPRDLRTSGAAASRVSVVAYLLNQSLRSSLEAPYGSSCPAAEDRVEWNPSDGLRKTMIRVSYWCIQRDYLPVVSTISYDNFAGEGSDSAQQRNDVSCHGGDLENPAGGGAAAAEPARAPHLAEIESLGRGMGTATDHRRRLHNESI